MYLVATWPKIWYSLNVWDIKEYFKCFRFSFTKKFRIDNVVEAMVEHPLALFSFIFLHTNHGDI